MDKEQNQDAKTEISEVEKNNDTNEVSNTDNSTNEVKNDLRKFELNGYGNLPVCIAKTQYSFSVDPKLKGAPQNHEIPIREVRLSSGANFIVVVCGSIMTMPGLPRVPAADKIKLNKKGETEGLF